MAIPRRTPPLVAALLVALAVLLAVLPAAPGSATPGPPVPPVPTTSAQALVQLRAFNEQFEKLTERYNDARILLTRRTAESRVATARAVAARKAVGTYRDRIRQVVRSEARSEHFEVVGAMLTSASPGEFAARASLIAVVGSRRAAVLDEAGRASVAAARAEATATAAATAARTLTVELAAQRTDLAARAARSKALYARLSASERQAFLARRAAAARESRAEPVRTGDRSSRAAGGTEPVGTGDRSSRAAGRTEVGPAPAAGPVSGRAAVVVRVAKAQLGKPYVWAAEGPSTFDCSGLTMYAWAAAGVSLPHSSKMQINSGQRVTRSELRPGDLVFYGSPIHHVALYVGGGQVIHAPQTGDVVKYSSVDMMPIVGASRPG